MSIFYETLKKGIQDVNLAHLLLEEMLSCQHHDDEKYIQKKKQKLIDLNNAKESKKRTPHDYSIGDMILQSLSTRDPNMERKRKIDITKLFR